MTALTAGRTSTRRTDLQQSRTIEPGPLETDPRLSITAGVSDPWGQSTAPSEHGA